ncbi:MAG: hypothetical protein ABW133_07860 [Polyangiaceae bacterium]
MLDLVLTIALSILNIALPYAIVRYDRARLDSARRARAWNAPSFAAAIYFYGPLSLPAHFWVTRRKFAALLFGVVLTIAVLTAEWGVATLLESIFE